MNWLSRLLGHSTPSAEIAKNRLKLVLTYDRTNLTPEMMNLLQDEIVGVISRHLDIDRGGMMFTTQRGDERDHLVADIPIIGSRYPKPNTGAVPVPPRRRSARRTSKPPVEN
jgi:cell division topological specificity factor